MTAPKRVQLSRARGSRIPEGVVVVDRRTKWGNPFKLKSVIYGLVSHHPDHPEDYDHEGRISSPGSRHDRYGFRRERRCR